MAIRRREARERAWERSGGSPTSSTCIPSRARAPLCWPGYGPKTPKRKSLARSNAVSSLYAKLGEEVCGDGWEYEALADKSVCLVADGLGHGLHAATAARAAVAILKEHRTKAPAEIVERAHDALRSTRGAALAIAEIDHSLGVVRFCGVGNIAGTIVSNDSARHMVSLNGTAGQEVRKIVEFTYPWNEESTLIMHSDGLLSRWDLQGYPTLAQRHPSLIAAVLYRDLQPQSRRCDGAGG